MVMAFIHLYAGDYEEALDYLEEVLSIPSTYNANWIESDPDWDRVRDMPRYKRIIATYKDVTF